jgi:hypothetical protein
VPSSHYIHPEFGVFCLSPCFRRRLGVALACLVVAGVGAAVMTTADRLPKLAAAVTRADEASIADTTAATSLAPFAAVVLRLPIGAGAQTAADKPSCVGDTQTEGNCVSVKLRKPRMVWVANHRPAIAAVALGRSAAPMTGSIDAALLAAHIGSQGDPAAVAAASSTEPQNAGATPKNKKAQKSARGQNHRRDQNRYGAPSWRAVRVDDWAARGYAPRERDYQRRAYGRGGFTPNFW